MEMREALIDKMVAFIEGIGIPVQFAPLTEATFLPGILIDRGQLVVDRAQLAYPGDLLHEAGHIAVMDPPQRGVLRGDVSKAPGDEMASICWSWAALKALDLPADLLFHPHGYKGGAEALVENFEAGRYVGLPLLSWYGMSAEPPQAEALGLAPFPQMTRWLR